MNINKDNRIMAMVAFTSFIIEINQNSYVFERAICISF